MTDGDSHPHEPTSEHVPDDHAHAEHVHDTKPSIVHNDENTAAAVHKDADHAEKVVHHAPVVEEKVLRNWMLNESMLSAQYWICVAAIQFRTLRIPLFSFSFLANPSSLWWRCCVSAFTLFFFLFFPPFFFSHYLKFRRRFKWRRPSSTLRFSPHGTSLRAGTIMRNRFPSLWLFTDSSSLRKRLCWILFFQFCCEFRADAFWEEVVAAEVERVRNEQEVLSLSASFYYHIFFFLEMLTSSLSFSTQLCCFPWFTRSVSFHKICFLTSSFLFHRPSPSALLSFPIAHSQTLYFAQALVNAALQEQRKRLAAEAEIRMWHVLLIPFSLPIFHFIFCSIFRQWWSRASSRSGKIWWLPSARSASSGSLRLKSRKRCSEPWAGEAMPSATENNWRKKKIKKKERCLMWKIPVGRWSTTMPRRGSRGARIACRSHPSDWGTFLSAVPPSTPSLNCNHQH